MADESLNITVNVDDKDSSSKLSSLNAGFVALTAAVVGLSAVVVKSVQAAADFEKQMANVGTLLGKDALGSIGLLEQGLKDLSSTTGTSLEELADGLFYVVSAGVETEKQMGFLASANELAVAGTTDLSTSISALVGFMKAYGDESVDAGEAADLLFQINKEGFTTFEEVATSINKVTTFANLASVSQGELAGAMATLVGTTGNAAEVATQLNAVFKNLVSPSANLESALNDIGYASGSAAIEALGLQGTLDTLLESVDGNEQAMTGFFTEAEAVKAVIPLVGAVSETFTENLEEMESAAGAVTEAFEIQQATFDRQIAIMSESLNVLMVDLGATILPHLTEAVGKLTETFNQNKETITFLADVLATVLVGAIELVIMLFEGLKIWGDTVEDMSANLYLKWMDLKDAFMWFADAISDYVMPKLELIIDVVEKIIDLADRAWAALSKLGGGGESISGGTGTWMDGGMVYAQEGFVSKGVDTVPAMLRPGEIVLNAAQQRNLAGTIGSGVTIVIDGIISSKEVAEEYADVMLQKLQLSSKVV